MEGSLVAYKVFSNGSVLNASEINDNLMNQSVMVFSNSTARSAALPSPLEGMLTWLEDGNRYEYRNGAGAWVPLGSGVLQTLSAFKGDTSSSSTTTFADVSGLSVSITPSSTSSKILVTTNVQYGGNTGVKMFLKLFRDSTEIAQGDAAGSRTRVFAAGSNTDQFDSGTLSTMFLDSPATISPTTYKVQFASWNAGAFVYVNRTHDDGNSAGRPRMASTITVQEIS
jgi:hypothetical protein